MEYYNIARSLTAAKNDCAAGVIGTSVTLIANANQFASTISVEDANAKADAWLAANVQAYANNTGSCRITAWRGVNPSCVVEPTVTLSPFNYMVIRYKWALGAGQDFDTYTGIINSGTSLDNKWMGWGHGFNNEIPVNALAADSYIMWAGDNTQANGVESCLVNFSKITTDYPTLNTVQLRMAGSWYRTVGTGNIDVEIVTYLGGAMEKSGYDIINVGGTLVDQKNFSKKVPIQGTNLAKNIEAVTNLGYITYIKDSSTGQIVIKY
ncbi:DUF5977 domain-containing protein [Flavobacterium chilense]|uniref:DUF5977 domain-containing protein n=1 Tax=Flavobacterium chilense TaxID=946677 RepID=A0A1M7ESE2_9FLAO|nr:DUF5977 domain-containing protein [Flavobacterium chilense]SHL94664.1 hypothetical protein SAMN05444484_10355 [Flavobacterium chilense]